MKIIKNIKWLLFLILIATACSSDPEITPDPPTPEPPQSEIKEGFNVSPEKPDADKELTVTFKAPKSSQLYGYTGDVYIHTGVVSEGTWLYVPAEWEENIAKCKMTKLEDNVWSIKYSPTIRQWFNSGETAINKIGIVIRSADGTKKGVEDDYFITVTDSKYKAFEPGEVKNATQPGGVKHGINIVDNNTVTLVLYEKDKNGNRKDFAHVVGDFNDWTLSNTEKSQMYRDEAAGTWWITISGLDSSKEYAFQYYVGTKDGETIRVADPYSRKILDPDNDKYISAATYPENKEYPEGAIGIVSVFKTVENTYSWRVPNFEAPDVSNMVIYEMLLRDFTESGDLNGAMQKLDYLQSLGVNAIELMPVQEFDGNDSWGYNPIFFFAMDKAYGTDRMYKEFIDACHERGIAVILDVVYNHADNSNPFAKLYWNSSNNKPATNNPWFNVDAPDFYSVYFNDFNHESDLVREFVKRNLTFLIEEYNIDGFRFDLTKGFTQNPSTEGTASIYDASRIAILKDYNATIKEVKPETYVILEHFCDDREETELSNDGMMVWRNMNYEYCESAMGYSDKSSFSGLYYGTSSRPANSLISYMESHDEERAAYKQTQWGNGQLKTDLNARMSQLGANAAFFFTVPGPKMIWQFGEVGYDISINSNINGVIDGDKYRTAKKPIKWEYYDEPARKGLYDTYSRLIALRNEHPELFTSGATFDWNVSTIYWNNGRFLTLTGPNKDKHLVVVGNFTNNDGSFSTTFPITGEWYNYMNSTDTLQVDATTIDVSVPANNFKIYTSFSTTQ